MGKVFGILLIVGFVWMGVEVMTKGTDGAFGGALAALTGETPIAPEDHQWAGERARGAVDRAQDLADQRRSRVLGQ